jgi:Zn-finger protein
MKNLIFDVMLNGRFVCTLCYKYCPLFPLSENKLHDFVVSKRPTLKNQHFNIVF